ncbi:hypothetical protein F4678DRAFT_486227 [Xylaria arbuscula]|nr:hypothetical protein F4678DRAFT_486227 [Xylaria arbuscula]
MAAPSYRRLLAFLALFGAMVSATSDRVARSRSQFTQIPKDYAANILSQALEREDQCKAHYDNYTNPYIFDDWEEGHVHASNLASCILDQLPEWAKSEFTTVSIALGLIPPTIQVLGPDTTGIALLSMRRPLLASLLSFGSPAIRVGADPVEVLRSVPRVKFNATYLFVGPGDLNWKRRAFIMAVSAVEYGIAGAAVFSVAYHVWFLTYQAVCWAAIQLFQTTHLPETAAPLFWVLFVVPVKLMCDFAIRWRVKKTACDGNFSGMRNRGIIETSIYWTYDSICSELTPYMYSKPFYFHTIDEGPAWLFFSRFLNLASLAQLLMGGIILSTMFFVGFRDTIITATWFLSSAVACRIVVAFELYWMRLNALEIPSDDGYKTVARGQDKLILITSTPAC